MNTDKTQNSKISSEFWNPSLLVLLLERLRRRARRRINNNLRMDRLDQSMGDGGNNHQTSEGVHRRIIEIRSGVDGSWRRYMEKLTNRQTLRGNQLLGSKKE